MRSISKATWFSLLTVWIVGVVVIIALAATPDDPPALLRVPHTRGPVTDPALITMQLDRAQWASR